MTRRGPRRYIPIGVLILAPLAVLGAAGQLPLDQLTVASAHHVFHILFPVVAFCVFAVFVAHDISRHGWPAFSWRLNVDAEHLALAGGSIQSDGDPPPRARIWAVRPRPVSNYQADHPARAEAELS